MADDVKFVIGVDDDDVVKTLRNVDKLEKEIKSLEKEYKRLAKAQNSGGMSAQAYAKGVAQVDAKIAHLNKVLASGSVAINAHATALVQSKNKMNKFGMVSQQVGYQVGDFFVQVQSGSSALVAFGQQGTQLAGLIPGLGGAIAGIGLSLGTLLVKGYMDSQKSAENANKAFEESESALTNFEDKVKEAKQTVSSFSRVMADINNAQTKEAWYSLGETTAEQFSATFVESILASLKGTLRGELGDVGGFSGQVAAQKFAAAFNQETLAIDLGSIERAIKDKDLFSLDLMIRYFSAFTDVNAEGMVFLENLINARDAAAGFSAEIKAVALEISDAKGSANDLADLDLALGIGEAAKVTELLANNLSISLSEARKLVGLATGTFISGPDAALAGVRDNLTSTGLNRDDIVFKKTYAPTKPKKTGRGKTPQEQLAEFLTRKKEEAALQAQLVGLFDEERSIQSELIKFKQKYGDVASKTQTAEYAATVQQIAADKERQKVLAEAKKQQEDLADFVANSMGDALMSIVDGTMTVKDAFKSMASDIIKELYRVLVVERMVQSIKGFLSPTPVPNANGNAFSNGSIQAYANGGVVGGPTYFPMSGGKTGLMGEAGPEAIMPLKRGANGKLGVQMEGGGQSVVVNQSFNFSANGDDSVKKIIAQAAPQIANMTKKSIMDDRRRGGQMKATFG
jgi:hypothetical protein